MLIYYIKLSFPSDCQIVNIVFKGQTLQRQIGLLLYINETPQTHGCT